MNIDYNKILKVTKLNYEQLDKDTLLFDNIVIGIEKTEDEVKEIYLNIELWTDSNDLRIVEVYPDDSGSSIEDLLSEEYYNHIKKLVENATNKKYKWSDRNEI